MKLKPINGYYNVQPQAVLPMNNPQSGYLENVSNLSIGGGNNVLHADREGFWMGAKQFANAPLRINMAGEINISNGDNSSSLNADRLLFYNNGIPEILIGENGA